MSEEKTILDHIREAPDREYANVLVREWGNLPVRLRSWSAIDRMNFDTESAAIAGVLGDEEADKLFTVRAVAWSIVDKLNEPAIPRPSVKALLSAAKAKREAEAKKDEAELVRIREEVDQVLGTYLTLAGKSLKGMLRLWRIVAEFNGMGDDEDEEIEKN